MKFSLLDDKYRRVRGREWLHPDLGRSKVDLSGYGPMLELLVSVPSRRRRLSSTQANDMMQVMFVPPAEEESPQSQRPTDLRRASRVSRMQRYTSIHRTQDRSAASGVVPHLWWRIPLRLTLRR